MSSNGQMKRTRNAKSSQKSISPSVMKKLQDLSALTSRLKMAGQLGMSHKDNRDLYESLGYPEEVNYADVVRMWERQSATRAIVDRPVKATWKGELIVTEPDQEEETELEKAYKKLDDRLNLKSQLMRADRLAQMGEYSVLLLGFNDVEDNKGWRTGVETGERELLYTRPVGYSNAEIATYESDPTNPRFGKPRMYKISLEQPDGEHVDQSQTTVKELKVHHSRIIHIAFDLLENDIEGNPIAKSAYNRLKDIEKLVGGSAEMFWRGARPGYFGSSKEDYKVGTDTEDELKKQIDEYEHNLRRFLVAEGVDMQSLDQQVADPESHVKVQFQMLSAVTGIPLRVLLGSERGELASSQDQETWNKYVDARRTEEIEPIILRPFVDRMMKYGVLPEPTGADKYSVTWPDLGNMSEKDKSEIGKERAQALAQYVRSPMAEQLVPLEAFLKFFLKLNEDQVDQIMEMSEQQLEEMLEEEAELEEEEQEIQEIEDEAE